MAGPEPSELDALAKYLSTGQRTIYEVAEQFFISPRTAYHWLDRLPYDIFSSAPVTKSGEKKRYWIQI
jgi:hypothetical protein